jgi:hypothetical protein
MEIDMKQNFVIYAASVIIFIFISLPGSVFCEPVPLDDEELARINAQAGSAIPSVTTVNDNGEVIYSSTEQTGQEYTNESQAIPAGPRNASPLNDMQDLSNMNQFSNMGGAGAGGGASCH